MEKEQENNDLFAIVEEVENSSIEAEAKKAEFNTQLQRLQSQREQLLAQINFYTGVATASQVTASRLLEARGLTFNDYNQWKALKDAPASETQH